MGSPGLSLLELTRGAAKSAISQALSTGRCNERRTKRLIRKHAIER